MNTWLIDLADAVQTHEGTIVVEGGALVLRTTRGIVEAYGQGEWKSAKRQGFTPHDRTDKPPKREPPTADEVATAVAGKFGDELGKHLDKKP